MKNEDQSSKEEVTKRRGRPRKRKSASSGDIEGQMTIFDFLDEEEKVKHYDYNKT